MTRSRAVATLLTVPRRGARRRRYTRPTESARGIPTEVADFPSPITPAGIVQGYGNIFRAMRSPRRGRRIGAIVFTAVFLLPTIVIVVGYAVMLLRAL